MKNWKTTTIGFVAAALSLWAEGMTFKGAVQAAGVAAIGAVARDAGRDRKDAEPKREAVQ